MVDETVRVWLVDRTYDDESEQVVVAVYATPDGSRFLRREIGTTSDHASVPLDDPARIPVAIDVDPDRLATVSEAGIREVYATGVADTRREFGSGDHVDGGPRPEA